MIDFAEGWLAKPKLFKNSRRARLASPRGVADFYTLVGTALRVAWQNYGVPNGKRRNVLGTAYKRRYASRGVSAGWASEGSKPCCALLLPACRERRILPGILTTVGFAAATPKGLSPAAQATLGQIITETKAAGIVQQANRQGRAQRRRARA